MRVAIAIPHFFKPDGEGQYGSVRDDSRPRVEALTNCLVNLHAHFGSKQFEFYYFDHMELRSANESTQVTLDIFLCTKDNSHVLSELTENGETNDLFFHVPIQSEDPKLLGFGCHQLLADRLGDYDYYCYLEDDLIIHDPYFFWKIKWFTEQMGNQCVLQPMRFEIMQSPVGQKIYIDPDFEALSGWNKNTAHNFIDQQELEGRFLNRKVMFGRAGDPHSGCFFLNSDQMHYWSQQAYFLDVDTRFVGPLESAASLGLMKAFRVYKPAVANANFLEIQHSGTWNSNFFIENLDRLIFPARQAPVDG
ncbi:MAG: calcium-binding protein [Cyanophyceae cyanobacterium]